MTQLEKGCVVSSRQGRDAGKLYVVWALDIDAGRVWLVNGAKRTLAKPKAKNIRHVMPAKTVLPAEAMKSDLALKGALRAIEEKRSAKEKGNQGGRERQEVSSFV